MAQECGEPRRSGPILSDERPPVGLGASGDLRSRETAEMRVPEEQLVGALATQDVLGPGRPHREVHPHLDGKEAGWGQALATEDLVPSRADGVRGQRDGTPGDPQGLGGSPPPLEVPGPREADGDEIRGLPHLLPDPCHQAGVETPGEEERPSGLRGPCHGAPDGLPERRAQGFHPGIAAQGGGGRGSVRESFTCDRSIPLPRAPVHPARRAGFGSLRSSCPPVQVLAGPPALGGGGHPHPLGGDRDPALRPLTRMPPDPAFRS